MENNKNVELNIYGLKCDNASCDYEDMSVPREDYEQSIGKPCPKCGESLLTQEDYDKVLLMEESVRITNLFSPEQIEEMTANISEEDAVKIREYMTTIHGVDFKNVEDGSK